MVGAWVVSVKVVVAFPPLVGVTFAGEKEQVVLAGSPEQVKAT